MRVIAAPEHVVVTLDDRFFTLGPVIMADEAAGIIDYHPVDGNGNFMFDAEVGAWRRARVSGTVRIYDNMGWC
jgi:hypothetical protein